MILQCCKVLQATVAESGEEGRGSGLHEKGGNGNGMDGGIYCSRDEEEKGGGHLALHLLKKNLWGQPIRGRVTPLSSQLACKSCATRQPTCLCSMNTWPHKETHEQENN